MKQWLGTIILVGILTGVGSAAGQGPEVLNLNQKISINADDITLGDLLRLWDRATGMQSQVPPALANRHVSLHFAGLSINDALQRIFNGQPFGYAVVGQAIVVTEPPQNAPEAAPATEALPAPMDNNVPQVVDQPIVREKPGPAVPPPQQQSIIVRTPFGPVLSPTGDRQPEFIQLPPVPGTAPPPPFFATPRPVTPPAGAPNGPAENTLFGLLPIYQSPSLPIPR